MKATLRSPLPKVNIDVELCQRSCAGGRGAATGPSGRTPDLGQSPLSVHRTTAWDGQVLGDRRPARGVFTPFQDAL